MSVREGLEFGAEIESDCAPLGGLVAAMLAVTPDLHVLRDPTRGGLAAVAQRDRGGLRRRRRHPGARRPGPGAGRPTPAPSSAWTRCTSPTRASWWPSCPREHADAVLAAMRAHPLGADAAVIGECVEEHPGMVVARTGLGGTRVVDLPIGEQLPRIC